MINLDKILKNGKAMFLAYDQGMEHGPVDFNDLNVDPNYILDIAYMNDFTAIVLQKGIAEKYYTGTDYQHNIPLIMKLNGKTNLFKGEAYAPQECTVEEALKLGAVAVGYTIFAGSVHEAAMVKEFGNIVKEAHENNIPVIAWVYPRGKDIIDDQDPKIVAYAARLALELGADMAKIKYSGSQENFAWAVKAAGKMPVVLSGGNKTVTDEEFLEIVRNVMAAGGTGIAVGRNVWQHPDPISMSKKIAQVIWEK
ncbi:aldolase [Candidatus Azambacteria bacterium]|nr:aldolase [Candidatus Azambacteria bacterium]